MHDASCFIYVLKCETFPGVATLKQKLGAVHNDWWPSETHISHELKMTFKNFHYMHMYSSIQQCCNICIAWKGYLQIVVTLLIS